MGEGDGRMSKLSKGARESVVRSTATESGRWANDIGLGGVNADGSSVKRWPVLGKVSISCVVPATTGADEVPGLRGSPMAV